MIRAPGECGRTPEMTEMCFRPGGLFLTEKLLELTGRYRSLGEEEAISVLDVGCGSGATVHWLSARFPAWHVMGIDPACEEDSQLKCASGEAIPAADHSFDLVLMECSFSRMEQPEDVLREILRVLKPDGKLLVSDLYRKNADAAPAAEHDGRNDTAGSKTDWSIIRLRIGRLETALQLQERFRRLGYRVLECQDVSRVLGDWMAQKIMDGETDALDSLLGCDRKTLRQIGIGYYIGIWEPSPLPEILRYAAENSPFYRERMGGTGVFELSDIPFTREEDIRRDPEAFLCVPQKEIARIITLKSSGSTGKPKRLFFTEADLLRTAQFFSYGIQWLVEPGYKVGVFMEGPSRFSVGGLLKKGLSRIGVTTEVFGFIRDYADAAQKAAACDTLIGAPAQMHLLAREAPQLRPKTVLLSADFVPDAVKRGLEETWNCRVFTHWGMTETGYGGGVQCSAREGYHMRDEDLLLEIIDPQTGKVVPAGEYGEITITTLRRKGMPLIRYRTGDLGRMRTGPCPCGCLKPRLDKVMGRIRDAIRLPDGVLLSMPMLDECLYALPGLGDFSASWEETSATLRITVQTAGAVDKQELCREVREALRRMLPDIRVLAVPGKVESPVGSVKRKLERSATGDPGARQPERILTGAPGIEQLPKMPGGPRTAPLPKLPCAALITAAGLSSRMGAWKAFLEIDGVPALVRQIRTFLETCSGDVWILTGYRSDELKERLGELLSQEERDRVHTVYNPRYAQTQMFDSIRLGLNACRDRKGNGATPEGLEAGLAREEGRAVPEGLFLVPVDVPLFTEYTLRAEWDCLTGKASDALTANRGEQTGYSSDAVTASCGEQTGHPVLLRYKTLARICRHDGSRGLRGALERMGDRWKNVPTPDMGAFMDADTPEEFERLLDEAAERKAPTEARCRQLLSFFGATETQKEHGQAVAQLAEELALACEIPEARRRQIRAAGWLHDIAKGRPHHAALGAEWLRMLGYAPEIVDMVKDHMEVAAEEGLTDRGIVFLADKLVRGNRRVSLEERFAPGKERFRGNPEALTAWRRRYEASCQLFQLARQKGFRAEE